MDCLFAVYFYRLRDHFFFQLDVASFHVGPVVHVLYCCQLDVSSFHVGPVEHVLCCSIRTVMDFYRLCGI